MKAESCYSSTYYFEYKVNGKTKFSVVCCPLIHSEKEKCECSLEETIKYNQKFGYLPKKLKLKDFKKMGLGVDFIIKNNRVWKRKVKK